MQKILGLLEVSTWSTKQIASVVTVLAVGFVASLLFTFDHNTHQVEASFSKDQEYQYELSTKKSFSELADFFVDVAKKEGGEYAFDLLIQNNDIAGQDTHLLGHFIGDVLYKQKGIDAISICTPDLGYACAHSTVIGALLEKGPEVFNEIHEVCNKVEGPNAYNMCFHGFGHGVLAYVQYELPDAIKLCQKLGTKEHYNQEAVECLGGVIMEMRGGIHDPIVWQENGTKYLSKDNPLKMCQSDVMPADFKVMCYIYVTPFIFDSVTNSDLPSFDDYHPATTRCENVTNDKYRYACYGGFAKEFVNFVFGRDVRQVAKSNDEDLHTMLDACMVIDNDFGRRACVEYSVYALYRSGNNPYQVTARFCAMADDKFKDICYDTLKQKVMTSEYFPDSYKQNFCTYLKEQHHRQCTLTNNET